MRKWLFGLLLLFSLSLSAHEVRPGYLQLKQIDQQTYRMFWKIPSIGDAAPKLRVVLPGDPQIDPIGRPQFAGDFIVFNYQVRFEGPLSGQPLLIEGLKKTLIDVLVRIEYLNGEEVVFMLQPDKDNMIVPGRSTPWDVIKTYTYLGMIHIWLGIDHLLFVLALMIITIGFRSILKTITAFTIAHSVTLSMSILGYASLPGPPVEAVIALSIVFLALEILRIQQGEQTLTSRKPWLVAFVFGLLHGFGFAGALTDVGLPQTEIPLALAFFNIGVEIGQIVFVLVVLSALWGLRKIRWKPGAYQKLAPYAIGSVAAFWVVERVVGFWG